MNQSDIEYIAKTLNGAIKQKDWELVTEVLEYISEFQDHPDEEEY